MRRSEKRRRIMPPLRGGVNAAPIRLPFPCDGEREEMLGDAGSVVCGDGAGRGDGVARVGDGAGRGWQTLGEWFYDRFGEQGMDMLARGDVLAGHGKPIGADYPYTPGERIWVFRPVLDEPSEPVQLAVVAENERYMIVDKPHGMATVPKGSHVANSVLVAARRQFGNDLLIAAHRLDLETAGLVLLVKEPQWRGAYQKLFERRAIRKTYRAVAPLIGADSARVGARWHSELRLHKVEGELKVSVLHSDSSALALSSEPAFSCAQAASSANSALSVSAGHAISSVQSALPPVLEPRPQADAQFSYYGEHRSPIARTQANAVTDIELTRLLGNGLALYTLYPHTGFTHQLRVAMKELGAPICADPLYPRMMSLEEVAQRPYPLQLLAAELEFDDPVTGEPTFATSSLRLALE